MPEVAKSGHGQKSRQNGDGRPARTASTEAWAKIDSLVPDPANARVHDDAQIEKLRASVKQFGQVWPILVGREDHKIICHHGLWEALRAEGFKECKVIYADGLNAEQRRAFALADNRLAEASEWDKAALNAELAALIDLGFDMGSMGWEAEELERLLTQPEGNFKDLDENLPTDHECPKCHYKWSE